MLFLPSPRFFPSSFPSPWCWQPEFTRTLREDLKDPATLLLFAFTKMNLNSTSESSGPIRISTPQIHFHVTLVQVLAPSLQQPFCRVPSTDVRRHINSPQATIPGPPNQFAAVYPQVAAEGSAVVRGGTNLSVLMPAVPSPVFHQNSCILGSPQKTLHDFCRVKGSAAQQLHNPNYTKPRTFTIHTERGSHNRHRQKHVESATGSPKEALATLHLGDGTQLPKHLA